MDACPQAKATTALKIRGFLLADPEGITALEAHLWELSPAPWPCREGSRDGSRPLLHGAGGPALPVARSWDAEGVLAGLCLTFAIRHEMQPPLQNAQGLVSDHHIGCRGKQNRVIWKPNISHPCCVLVGSGAQTVQAEARSPKGWGRQEGKRGGRGGSRAQGQVPIRFGRLTGPVPG